MSDAPSNPIFRWSSLFVIALSYSIGWGIRGNFGHEYGAMMAGTLGGLAVSMFSGREDWRQRMPFFAFYGALGSGFGGSIAYMPVMAYIQADGLSNQIYGFVATFMVGALWTGMAGVGVAYAASEDRETLTATFRPLCWIFALWVVQYFGEDAFVRWYETHVRGLGSDASDFRQRSPLYWLDSEWVEATLALVALCAFDLWDRRFSKLGWLAALAAIGGLLGGAVQLLLEKAGLLTPLLSVLVHTQGDLTAVNPATGLPFDPADMITNWPTLFYDFPNCIGLGIGVIVGLAIYYSKFGAWSSGSKLLLYITVGSYLCFILCPVLMSNIPFFKSHGGFRMMAPRGDSWANTVGAMAGAMLYMARYNQLPVVLAGVVTFFLGGISFIVATFAKILAYAPGNPKLTQDPAVVQAWAHWRSANWHSLLTEQFVGFLYGLSLAIAMGLLVTRVRWREHEPRMRRWTEGFTVFFLLNLLLYVNLVKCLEAVWTKTRAGGFRSVPLSMKAPLFNIELPSETWFSLMFLAITVCTVALLVVHFRRRLELVPQTWLGKAQLIYLVFLWAIVLGNFMRIVPEFDEKRLATEALVMVNALVVTFMTLHLARDCDSPTLLETPDYRRMIRTWTLGGGRSGIAGVSRCGDRGLVDLRI